MYCSGMQRLLCRIADEAARSLHHVNKHPRYRDRANASNASGAAACRFALTAWTANTKRQKGFLRILRGFKWIIWNVSLELRPQDLGARTGRRRPPGTRVPRAATSPPAAAIPRDTPSYRAPGTPRRNGRATLAN